MRVPASGLMTLLDLNVATPMRSWAVANSQPRRPDSTRLREREVMTPRSCKGLKVFPESDGALVGCIVDPGTDDREGGVDTRGRPGSAPITRPASNALASHLPSNCERTGIVRSAIHAHHDERQRLPLDQRIPVSVTARTSEKTTCAGTRHESTESATLPAVRRRAPSSASTVVGFISERISSSSSLPFSSTN